MLEYYVVSYDTRYSDAFFYKYIASKKKSDIDALAVVSNIPYFHIEHDIATVDDVRNIVNNLDLSFSRCTIFVDNEVLV